MGWFDISITAADVERWLRLAGEYAAPRLLETGGQILLGAILYVTARWVVVRVERRITSRTRSQVDDHVAEAVRRVLLISVVVWVLWRTAHIWERPTLAEFIEAVWIVVASVPIADLVAKLLRVVEERIVPHTETTIDDTAFPLLNKVARFLIVAAAVIMGLSHIDVEIMPFIAGASVAGVAIGFAAKDTLSNLIAGVLLILDRPFDVGDRIELWETPSGTATWGDVVEIGLRATKIRNPDNVIFVVPNNQIMQRDIVNWTASGDSIRLRIPIGIAYDADPAIAKKIITEVALGVAGVIKDRQPKVIIRNFGESAVDLELRVWIDQARQRRAIMDEITDRVKEAFDRAGVEIPYAKRDLYIRAMPSDTGDGGKLPTANGGAAAIAGTAPEERNRPGDADE